MLKFRRHDVQITLIDVTSIKTFNFIRSTWQCYGISGKTRLKLVPFELKRDISMHD